MKTRTRSKTRPRTAYLGLDLHSATTVMAVTNEHGKLLRCERFATTGRNLVDQVVAVRANKKLVALEETPMTHWAVELLRPVCTRVVACDPKHNRWISRNAQKSDEADAERLARLLRLGELKEVYHSDRPDRFAFKATVQHYLDVQRDRVRAKNKIKALLKRAGLPGPLGTQAFSSKYRQVLLELMPGDTWRASLARRYRHFDWLHAESREALREVERMGQRYPEVAEFRKVPGIGPVGSNAISAFLQTPHRFENKSALFRYAALSITDRSSDNKPLGYQRLERGAGCIELKRATYHAWLGAISTRYDNEVKAYYQAALEHNGQQHKRARLTTQRKILATLWALWRTGASYEPDLFRYHHNPRTAMT